MKTIEEMAYGYACNKLVPNAQHDNSAEIASLQNTLIDFTQKVLVEYNRWYDPKEELPPDDMEVLCRIDCCYNTYLILRHNNLGWWMLASNGGRCVCAFEVVGWRPIHG